MVRGSNPKKVREWAERLARFRKSPMSVARFCLDEGVSTCSFYHWQRKLRQLDSNGNVQHTGTRSANKRVGFQELKLSAAPPLTACTAATNGAATMEPALTVCLPQGIQVHVADHVLAIQTVMRELTGYRESTNDNCQPETRAC